jgi:cell division protein FtsB
MSTRQRKRSKLKPLLLPVSCLLIISYFAYHAVEGEYGLSAHARLADKRAVLEHELAGFRDDRLKLERQVRLMRSQSLDTDLVDERARRALNLAHRNDVVIFIDRSSVFSKN